MPQARIGWESLIQLITSTAWTPEPVSRSRRSNGTAVGSSGYRACDVETAPYPGLATDLQPPTAVLLTQATGASQVHEQIFEDRLEWLSEVRRMGANVEVLDPHHATITGPTHLVGTEVEIGDLRPHLLDAGMLRQKRRGSP